MLAALWGVSVIDLERGRNCGQTCALGHSKASFAEFSFDSFGKSSTHGGIKNLLNELSNSAHCSFSLSLSTYFHMFFPLEVQGVQCKRPWNSSLNTKCRQIPCPTPSLSTAPPLSSLDISTLTPPSSSWLLFISCLIGSISQTTAGFYKWNQLAYLIFASEVFCSLMCDILFLIVRDHGFSVVMAVWYSTVWLQNRLLVYHTENEPLCLSTWLCV